MLLALGGAADAALAEGPAASGIDEIEVIGHRQTYRISETSTATKTPTRLIDIPQSLTLISSGMIRDQAMQNMGDVVLRSAWISHNGKVFRLAGLSGTGAYRQLQQAVDASVRSFEPLSAGEAERIRPNVIELHTAKAGDTWQSLAAGPGRNVIKPETLAIMNGYPAQERPQAGDRIKIVVEGR